MLVHACDARAPAVAIGERRRRLAGEAHDARVRLAQPGEDRHERRLARAVAADERVRLARPHAQVDVRERDVRAEALRERARLDDGRAGVGAGARGDGGDRVHLIVLPHRPLSSTFAFVTSGAGN